ncbi:MAG: CvpA family protein [Planctomycetota bacterium]
MEDIWASLNWVDLVLGLGLLAALLVGVGMGFYRQLAIIASLVVAWVLASQFTTPLAQSELFASVQERYGASGAEFAAYGTIILSTVCFGLLSILIFRRYFGKTLKMFDSALGGATGVGIAGLAAGLLVLGIFHWEETWLHGPLRESVLGSRLAEGARYASTIFPDEYRDRVEASLEQKISDLATSGNEERRSR